MFAFQLGVVLVENIAPHFGENAGQLHPARAATGDHEMQIRRARFARLGAGGFQLRKDIVADGERVAERFHRIGVLLHFAVAKIIGLRAEGDDECVVGDAVALFEEDALGGGIDARHRAFAVTGARVAVEQLAERVTDIRGRHEARRDLINQRREKVVIVLVNQGDAVLRIAAEIAREIHTGETAAEDDNFLHVCPCAVGKTGADYTPAMARFSPRLRAHGGVPGANGGG